MPSITIPNPAHHHEVRADAIIMRNDLSKNLPDPSLITLDMLVEKYGEAIIDRVLEPQDADGKQVGPRTRAASLALNVRDVLTRTYARPDGSTFTGMQWCWDAQILADYHKAEGLLPVEPENKS
jgi:hypothetical protein